MAAKKRISKELADLKKDPYSFFSLDSACEEDPFLWNITLQGTVDSPYEDGIFFAEVKFPEDYPFKPPEIKFLTKIFHPNINSSGIICRDCFEPFGQWSPTLTARRVLLAVQSLMESPIDCCNWGTECSNIFLRDASKYYTMARERTLKYAMDSKLEDPGKILEKKDA